MSCLFLAAVVIARAEPARDIRLPAGKAPSYTELVPDADYQHASTAAYEAFQDMKFAVRIHWGIYSIDALGNESWPFLGLSNEGRQRYNNLYKTWNPQGFDAEQWMRFFDEAGFKGLAFTAKHHEGFAMFDTKTRVHSRVDWTAPGGPALESCDLAYDIMETPFHRDVVKEICDAAHRHGLMIDLYFSHPDWYDADFRPYGTSPEQVPGGEGISRLEKYQNGRPATIFPPVAPAEQQRMIARHREQLRELLTNYGKIDMVCLDISLGAEVWPQLKQTIKELRGIQPDVMFRDRGIGNYGDYYTPERFVPGSKENATMPWMVIYPLANAFSYDPVAAHYKGAKWVIDNLVDCAAKGGNFMVGIGPDGDGRFHPAAVSQLEEAGRWLKVNGEAIYATRARPGNLWKEGEEIRFTRSKDQATVYAISLVRPGATLILGSVTARPGSQIRLLGQDEPLNWRQTERGLEIEVPAAAPEEPAYAFKISQG